MRGESKQTSKWPNTFILILGYFEPQWVGERERERGYNENSPVKTMILCPDNFFFFSIVAIKKFAYKNQIS